MEEQILTGLAAYRWAAWAWMAVVLLLSRISLIRAPVAFALVGLALVVGFESLAVAATVPTWAWFALGGSALLGTGIYLERKDTSPVAAGRRVVDAISANFS